MSVVTNLMLCDVHEEQLQLVDRLNSLLAEERQGKFREVSQNAGGPKMIESPVYMVACNHLPRWLEDRIAEVVRNARNSDLQLFVRHQDDDRWALLAEAPPNR